MNFVMNFNLSTRAVPYVAFSYVQKYSLAISKISVFTITLTLWILFHHERLVNVSFSFEWSIL